MKVGVWVVMLAIAAALGYGIWLARRRWRERQRAADERLSSFMVQMQLEARQKSKASSTGQDTAGRD